MLNMTIGKSSTGVSTTLLYLKLAAMVITQDRARGRYNVHFTTNIQPCHERMLSGGIVCATNYNGDKNF